MNNYFQGLHTVEAIKAQYRKLAMKHHPDRGGDVEAMKEINAQYQRALKSCDGQRSYSKNDEGAQQEHTYQYNEARERELAEKIAMVVGLGLDCELIGAWVWVESSERTRPHKDDLKGAGFWWHSKRACWVYKPEGMKRSRYARGASMDDLREKYGSRAYHA